MATPVIYVNSATGANPPSASGAGPSTAITGTAASFSGSVITLDGSPNLSGVPTDGSAIIYLATTTGRKFFPITAVNDGADTVTVSDAPAGTATGLSWAIGGKLASIGNANARLLFDQGGTAGDWKPGWIVELESGHSETLSDTLDLRGVPTSAGTMTLRGAAGAATLPILTFSNDGNALVMRLAGAAAEFPVVRDFELRNSAAGKTASQAVLTGSQPVHIANLKIDHATNYFRKGVNTASSYALIEGCRIGNCGNVGIEATGSTSRIINCEVFSCGGGGILKADGGIAPGPVIGCLIRDNTGDGLSVSNGGGSSQGFTVIMGNTFSGNTGDGIEFTDSSVRLLYGITLINNIFEGNGGYGINWHASTTLEILRGYGAMIEGNAYYGNTSGTSDVSLATLEGGAQTGTDPAFTSSTNFAIGTGLKAKGYPVAGSQKVGTYGDTSSFVDPGAAQREEPAGGGGGTVYVPQGGGGGFGVWES
jgi:hypothetical protein